MLDPKIQQFLEAQTYSIVTKQRNEHKATGLIEYFEYYNSRFNITIARYHIHERHCQKYTFNEKPIHEKLGYEIVQYIQKQLREKSLKECKDILNSQTLNYENSIVCVHNMIKDVS